MKSNAWKKDFVVIMYSDYDHSWIEKTIPLTYLQAVRFISAKHWNYALEKGIVKIVTLTELETIKTLVRV
jgi:hypothetical protein